MAPPRDHLVCVVLKDWQSRHPGGFRYEAFRQHLGIGFAPVPLRHRWLPGILGALETRLIGRFHRPGAGYMYGFGLLLQEVSVALRMRRSRGSVFHAVRADVEICHLPRLSRGSGARLIATFHDPLGHVNPDRRWESGLTPDFLRNVDGIVALCDWQRGFFVDRMSPERVRVVHHGVDTAFFRPGAIEKEPASIIVVGSYLRDHETLAAATRLVWSVRPDAMFRVVGTGTMPEAFPEDVRLSGPRVDYIDGISDDELRALYDRSALAVIPVYAATANNALLEAMASGLPVVATDVGGIPEYLGTDAGLLTPPRDAEAMAAAILKLLEDRPLRETMGRAGRERAVRMFDYAVVAREMQAFYDAVRAWPQAPAAPF